MRIASCKKKPTVCRRKCMRIINKFHVDLTKKSQLWEELCRNFVGHAFTWNCIVYSQFSWYTCLSSKIGRPQQTYFWNVWPPFTFSALINWVSTIPAQTGCCLEMYYYIWIMFLIYGNLCFELKNFFEMRHCNAKCIYIW